MVDSLNHISFFCRTVTVLVFLVAFVGKLSNFSQFVEVITKTRTLPSKLSSLAGLFVLLGELVVVISLIPNNEVAQTLGFGVATLLIIGFCLVQIKILAMGGNIPCNCFGQSNHNVSAEDIYRNVVLLLLTLSGLFALNANAHKHEMIQPTSWLISILGVISALLLTRLSSVLRTLPKATNVNGEERL